VRMIHLCTLLSFSHTSLDKDFPLSNSLKSLLCRRTSLEGPKFPSFSEKLENYGGTQTVEFLSSKRNHKLIFKKTLITFSHICGDVEWWE